MEQVILDFLSGLITDFGITGALYVVIIISFIYYTPKMINRHFDTIDRMTDKFSDNLDKIVLSFEKKIDESNSWHTKHQENINKTNYRLKRIEDNLKIKE